MKWDWAGDGSVWLATGAKFRYRVKMLKNGDYSVIILGRKGTPLSGNHLGYYGLIDDAKDACEAFESEKGGGNG